MGHRAILANILSPSKADLERLKFQCPQALDNTPGDPSSESPIDLLSILAKGLQFPGCHRSSPFIHCLSQGKGNSFSSFLEPKRGLGPSFLVLR